MCLNPFFYRSSVGRDLVVILVWITAVLIPSFTGLRLVPNEAKLAKALLVLIPSFTGLRLVNSCPPSPTSAHVLIPSFTGLRLV